MEAARAYVPRDPSQGVLQPLVRAWWPTYVETMEAAGSSVPAFVRKAVDRLLACGDPENGFIRLRCPDCAAERALPFGFDRLFRPGKVRATSGLSRRAFRDVARDLQGRYEAGFDDRCDVLLGLTATRIHPAIVRRARGRLRLPRMAARFLVRIRGRGPGRRPEVSNHLERPFLALERLPLDGPDADPFDALRQVVLASSAFPLAFAPQPIRHCPGSDEPATCRVDQAREDLFIDGGIFEQNPIGLAADALIGEDGDGRPTLPAEASFYLLDPFERSFPRPTERAPPPPLATPHLGRAPPISYSPTARGTSVARSMSV